MFKPLSILTKQLLEILVPKQLHTGTECDAQTSMGEDSLLFLVVISYCAGKSTGHLVSYIHLSA